MTRTSERRSRTIENSILHQHRQASVMARRLAVRYPSDLAARVRAHQFLCRRRNARGEPQRGAWYCLPTRTRDWRIVTFYEADYPNDNDHTTVWPEVLEYLGHKWGKDSNVLKRQLGDNYTALPRGRVTRTKTRGMVTYNLMLGKDSPIAVDGIKRAFNLQEANVRVIYDVHENMAFGDPEELQRVLGQDLGLKGMDGDPFAKDTSWEEKVRQYHEDDANLRHMAARRTAIPHDVICGDCGEEIPDFLEELLSLEDQEAFYYQRVAVACPLCGVPLRKGKTRKWELGDALPLAYRLRSKWLMREEYDRKTWDQQMPKLRSLLV